MAISIDWATRIITVPRLDMPLVNVDPEIRTLDVNAFRLELKDLEDNVDGMAFPDTHRHVAPITVGGVSLARVVEIINGYRVEFEEIVAVNEHYRVLLTNANNNILDVSIVNDVSIASANSAGLTDQASIAADLATLKDKMCELWELHGLDPTTPLEITDNSRTTTNVTQTITDDGITTTVTRS